MTKKLLESYQPNKRLIERNKKKIEDEKGKDVPVVMGKVSGSSADFPYTKRHFSVQMNEPVEADKSSKRIAQWRQEIEQAEKETHEVEQFINGIEDVRDREIFTYRYIDGMKQNAVGDKVGYSKGRISQIISKYLKD